jgi:HD-GYP domain-containing protein (c-di-GMP phosphodiesterase class II)
LEIHTPELSIARTAVLDYFQSPQQRRLEKIFSWEEEYVLKPGKNVIVYLRMVAREVGLPFTRPYTWLLDGNPTISYMVRS